MRDVLRWLWDEIADRALAALGFLNTPGSEETWPRLWWCPTGQLTLLPLHAAGYHGQGASGAAVLDRVVSSYNADAAGAAGGPAADGGSAGGGADVDRGLARRARPVPLRNVVRERGLLVSLFGDWHTLLDESATTGAVRAQLLRHRWAHFSCHGSQNLADPSQGGLLLRDGSLTIADVSAQQHEGEFAFLSACMTAVGGVSLPDEAITLAAALDVTGYRRVIGTL